MTTITIDRALLVRALEALDNIPHPPWRNKELANDIRTELANTPAWHDAPTCDGLWLCCEGDDYPKMWTTQRVKFPINPLLLGKNERWYGPIPQDIVKAEGGEA